ncbi:MAG: MarR family transcriptional regulator [Desmonostoc vinosum HA7617-LM4]|jgi:DNA-binding MarR family transcriptional regulator|nr:MarR family transcriptional regulator [Desmonostoc vinosum HA7617-LM4]
MTKQAKGTTQTATQTAASEEFMPIMRELARAYQAFTNYSDAHVRTLGLTPAQFDIISTLGNTSGMSMNKLAEKTLITKGTLTGIIDRLEQKGLVRREVPSDNRRSFTVILTPAGEWAFEQFFPAHIAYLKERFVRLDSQELEQIQLALKKLREVF